MFSPLDTFRKLRHTDCVTNSFSGHAITHKLTTFHSYLEKLVTTPLLIRQIAYDYNFDENTIHKVLNRK